MGSNIAIFGNLVSSVSQNVFTSINNLNGDACNNTYAPSRNYPMNPYSKHAHPVQEVQVEPFIRSKLYVDNLWS
jgi:hypothetical protein